MGGDQQHPDQFGFGRLFYLTSEAIIAADLRDERIVLWNPAAERLFEYPASDALGMRLGVLVPPELREQHLSGLRRYRGGAEPVLVGAGPVVVPAVTKSGERRDVALSLTDVSVAGGHDVVVAILRDVTDQRRAERELAEANQTLREFVGTASHDLRSPLTSVVGFVGLLVERGESFTAEQRQEMLETVKRSAQHASRLVDDLLMLSQIRSSGLRVCPEAVSVAVVAGAARDHAAPDATVAIGDDLAVFADPDHVHRLLVNYLSNAVRYGAPPVRVLAAQRGPNVEIRVCDGGRGVPDAFVDQLFTAFARAEPSSRNGTGLGLSIVKGLAEANGGTAFYERTPEVGACFGAVLPASTGVSAP